MALLPAGLGLIAMFPHGITVTVRRTPKDRYGDATDTTSSHAIEGCGWWPEGSTEDTDRRDTVVTRRRLATPPDPDLLPADEVEFPDGTRWDVHGAVEPWNSPLTGWKPGATALLTRVTG